MGMLTKVLPRPSGYIDFRWSMNVTATPCCLSLNSACTFVQVKTLKPLSTLKLQQLISLMEEESFKDEEYIATEGQLGEKFFIVVLGNVRITNDQRIHILRSIFRTLNSTQANILNTDIPVTTSSLIYKAGHKRGGKQDRNSTYLGRHMP